MGCNIKEIKEIIFKEIERISDIKKLEEIFKIIIAIKQ